MMHSSFAGPGIVLLFGLHGLGMIAFGTGLFLLLCWAWKHMSAKDLCTWGWTLLALGAVVCLVTLQAAVGARSGMFGYGGMMDGRMMRWTGASAEKSAEQQQEEAEGKALYDRLQAGDLACADVSDSDFELIGEYAMGRQAGGRHAQMNAMMEQAMGQEGEEQMHILMGKRISDCLTENVSSAQDSPSPR